MSDWYNETGAPATSSTGSSSTMRNEFSAIGTAMDKLPALTGNGSKVVVVNSGGTALETVATLEVARGGTGAVTLTDGGILLGSGTGAITPMAVLTDGQIVIGDGTTDPTTLSAFTAAAGQLKHEYGGLEANISAVADGDFIVGTGAGTVGLESGATARTTMGLGSIATQNSNNISVTGGSATGLTNLSTTNFSIGGTAVTASAIELNYTDVTTPGTAQASKALVTDANNNLSGLGNLAVGGAARVWDAAYKVIDIGENSAIYEEAAGRTVRANNLRRVGGTWYYIKNGPGIVMLDDFATGSAITYMAPSGTAGAAATITLRHQISNDGTTTINGNVVRHNGNTFHGRVTSAGTALRLPAGWTSAKTSTGVYTVTHNLGSANYSMFNSTNYAGTYVVIDGDATELQVLTYYVSTGAPVNAAFNFVVLVD